MGKIENIDIKNLSREKFNAYGMAILKDEKKPPDSFGKGWECWYPIGNVMMPDPTQVGVVTTKPRPIVVNSLEKHQTRTELIIAVKDPIVQLVGLSEDAFANHPDPLKTEAFLINPGDAVLVNKGVWHSAAFPYSDRETEYLFFLAEDTSDEDVGFVAFLNGVSVEVKL